MLLPQRRHAPIAWWACLTLVTLLLLSPPSPPSRPWCAGWSCFLSAPLATSPCCDAMVSGVRAGAAVPWGRAPDDAFPGLPQASARRGAARRCRAGASRRDRCRTRLAAKVHSGDALDLQLLRFTAGVLPDKSALRIKQKVIERITRAARKVLGEQVVLFPFGSSASGCGEARADLDLVAYVPPSEAFPPSVRKALRKIAWKCVGLGFAVEEMRLAAKVPIIIVRTKDGSCSADVSMMNLLPLYNTLLLRSYVELEPFVAVLTIVVKRWAKAMLVGEARFGFLSSYSWTLMVIYYLQVCHALPCLHALALRGDEQPAGVRSTYATEFVTAATMPATPKAAENRVGVGALLRNFFHFYAHEFDWGQEVVSVRRGVRGSVADSSFAFKEQKGKPAARIHIEDPIDTKINLNHALREGAESKLRSRIVEASDAFRAGALLPSYLLEEAKGYPPSWRKLREKIQANARAFHLPRSVDTLLCECEECGLQMEHRLLLEHMDKCMNESAKGAKK